MAYASKNTAQGNRAGRGAVCEHKAAALSSEFGLKMLNAKFPEGAKLYLAKLGTFSRGPRKGLPRGYIHWVKVVEGGWDYSRNARGVMRPGCIEWIVREGADPESAAVAIPRHPSTFMEHNAARVQSERQAEIDSIEFELRDYPVLKGQALEALQAEFVKRDARQAERYAKAMAEYEEGCAAILA